VCIAATQAAQLAASAAAAQRASAHAAAEAIEAENENLTDDLRDTRAVVAALINELRCVDEEEVPALLAACDARRRSGAQDKRALSRAEVHRHIDVDI